MSTKFKIVATTFVGTTVFWFLVIVGLIRLLPADKSVTMDPMEAARRKGFTWMALVKNTEPHPMNFTVAALPANLTNNGTEEVVLLERQLPPAGELMIGLKKSKPAETGSPK